MKEPIATSGDHQHVALTPQPDKIAAIRELLDEVALRVTSKQDQNGPTSWCVSVGEDGQQFFVEAVFAGQDAVEFYQANIADLFARFGPLLAAPPETTIRAVIAAAG